MTDYRYLNIELYNNTLQPIQAVYQSNLNQAILDDPSKFKLSVIRFLIPSSTIPIFLFPTTPGYYKVTLTYSNTDFQTAVAYSGNTPNPYLPQPVYHFQDMVTQINLAFQQSFNALNTTYPGVVTNPPYMVYDTVTQLFTIYVPTNYENTVNIYMNSNLYSLFNNFNVKFFGFNSPSGKDVQLLVQDNHNNDELSGYYSFPQEYVALYYWYDLRKINITTNMSVGTEVNALPVNQASVTDYNPLLVDFEPLQINNESRAVYQYQPQILDMYQF